MADQFNYLAAAQDVKTQARNLRWARSSTHFPPPVGPTLDPVTYAYAEAAYFDGAHVQHIADWQEHRRLVRLREQAVRAARRTGR